MSKIRTQYVCHNCGANSPKWMGRCPSCSEWNTFVEEVVETAAEKQQQRMSWRSENGQGSKSTTPVLLSEVSTRPEERLLTDDQELNRVLGGGIVPGSVVLIGGEPGIGKSTLMLQVALSLPGKKVIYVTGEESEQQISMRAKRLGRNYNNCYLSTETSTQTLLRQIQPMAPDLVIIDSIQTMQSPIMESAPGSVSQIRECAGELQRYAKETGVPVFLIGHITKEGILAGPKVLEHIVDTVLQFEGERNYNYRILRTTKNRFGSTAELGIYEMSGEGLKEVKDPSQVLMSHREEQLSGIAIGATVEGLRPMLIEVQALVTQAFYGTPQRTSTGFDMPRLRMLLAVLEKRNGYHFGTRDVFLNIAGGLKVEDPAIDMAVTAALISSYEDTALPPDVAFTGEVGLSGEIRAVSRVEQRVAEADKLGLKKIYVPTASQKGIVKNKFKVEVVYLSKIQDLIRIFAQ